MTVYRTAGAWGPGLVVNLTPAQVDTNFYELRTDVDDLIANPPTPNEIASIEVAGTAMTITLEGGEEFGPYPLPVLMFRWRGEWAPLTLQAVLDSFSVENSGLYVSLRAHTTGATFDPDAVGPAVTAGAFAVGTLYRIATVGTTDFTAIGAASNTVGVDFTTTGAGTGTGTATPKTYYQLIGAGSNTALGDLLDVDVTGAAVNAMLVAVSVGSPATIEWQDRTPTQVTALLDDFVGDTGSPGGGIKGLVPAPADGDAAANKVLRADGTWGVGSTVAALDDLTDVSTSGAAVGDLLVAGGSPISWSPSAPGDIGSAISDLPLATLPLRSLDLMEIAETDGGSPASYTSKHIRISDLVHTLGSTAIAMGATVTAIAGLALTGLTGLAVRDASAAFDVTIAANSTPALSAGRTLSIDMSNVAHTLDLGATANTITFPSAASYTVAGLSVAGTWSATQSSMVLSGATLSGSTTLNDSGSLTSAGELGLGAGPTARLFIGGTYTTANGSLANIAGTFASSATVTQIGFNFGPTHAPSGASLANLIGVQSIPVINSTAFTISAARGVLSSLTLGASFSGSITLASIFTAANPTISGGTIANLRGFEVIAFSNGNNLAAGTVTNTGFYTASISAGAAGGTINNYGALIIVPSGGATSGTTNNRGIYITGNGGVASGSPPGTVNNFALISDSTALSQLMSLRIGTGSALATNATTGFLYLPACAGTPTGVPANAAAGAAATIYDTTGKKLWIYDQPTATWKGVVVA